MGRKRKADMATLYVRLPKPVAEAVWSLAQEKQQDMSTLVRAMIEETLLGREAKQQ